MWVNPKLGRLLSWEEGLENSAYKFKVQIKFKVKVLSFSHRNERKQWNYSGDEILDKKQATRDETKKKKEAIATTLQTLLRTP